MEQSNDEKAIDEVFIAHSKEDEIIAKLIELEYWKSRQVYKKVEDTFQKCFSLCWVKKSKIINNKPGTKACLCTRGFEEEQNYRTDSPICSREDTQIMFTLCASRKWPVNSIDIKTASSKVRICSIQYLWDHPKKLKPTKSGNYKNGYMEWLIRPNTVSIFLDDLVWAGNSELLQIIQKLKTIFQVGSENHKSLTSVGWWFFYSGPTRIHWKYTANTCHKRKNQ